MFGVPCGRLAAAASMYLVAGGLSAVASAEGTEELGVPTLAIGSGTGLALAGVGLGGTQPGTLTVEVPANGSVVQVLAYWSGMTRFAWEQAETDTVVLAGQPVLGQRVGGVTHIINQNHTATYRADITSLGLVGPGENVLAVEGLDFSSRVDGLGLAVVYDDGSEGASEIQVRDGSDYALDGFVAPLDDTVLQTFEFQAGDVDREAELGLMVGNVTELQTSVVEISIDGQLRKELLDVLGAPGQARWDVLTHRLTVPAGATSVAVRPVSRDSVHGPRAGSDPATLVWTFASLELTTPPVSPPRTGREGCGPWVWARAPHLWDGGPESMTENVHTWTRFNAMVGLGRRTTGMPDRASLMDSLWFHRRGFRWQRILNRHAAAALVNADSGIDYAFTVDEVVAMYRDAVGADVGPETVKSTLRKLARANHWRRECPLR